MYFSNRCISAAGSTDMPTTWAKKQTLPATPHRPEQVAGLLFEGHPARERLQTARCKPVANLCWCEGSGTLFESKTNFPSGPGAVAG